MARLVLLGSVIAHVWAAISLVRQNQAARPVRYQVKQTLATTYAAKVMPLGGLILVLFIIYHLLHFTTGHVAPGEFRGWQDAYHNFVTGFQVPAIAGVYVVANIFLGLHLCHGIWSMLQTLGINRPRYNHWRKRAATGLAVVVAGSDISFPIAVLAGVIQEAVVELRSSAPGGPIETAWDRHRFEMKLVNPANRRKFRSWWCWARASRAARRRRLGEMGTLWRPSASRTAPAAPTASRPRAASTPPRTTRATARRHLPPVL
ncbi:MAG: hypothetical protein R3F43_10220 [bacterium]